MKQTSLDKPVDAKWAADVRATGQGSWARDNESVAREATSLDTPVDAKRAAGTRAAGRAGVLNKGKTNPLHVKQPASIHQWMLNEQLARELLGGVPKKRKNESVACKASILDNLVDA